MSKKYFLIILGLTGFCAAGIAKEELPVDLSGKAASFKNAHKVFRESCLPCHSAQIPIPWYGQMPGVKQIMKQEYREAIEELDLDAEVYVAGQAPSPETLDKIEGIIEKGKMPPLSYRLAHPKARLSKKEKQAILDWIRDERGSLPAQTGIAAGSGAAVKKTNPFKPFDS